MTTTPQRAISLPPIRTDQGGELNEETSFTEFLLIKLEHDIPNGITNVSFEGMGFDVSNDDIVVDILNTAATVYDYVVVAEEDVTYVLEDEDEEDSEETN